MSFQRSAMRALGIGTEVDPVGVKSVRLPPAESTLGQCLPIRQGCDVHPEFIGLPLERRNPTLRARYGSAAQWRAQSPIQLSQPTCNATEQEPIHGSCIAKLLLVVQPRLESRAANRADPTDESVRQSLADGSTPSIPCLKRPRG